MKRTKRMIGWAAAAALVLLVLLIVGTQWLRQDAPVAELSQEQAVRSVLTQYEGEIEHVQLREGSYMMRLRSTQGLYELKVNPVGGIIHSIQRLETPASSSPVATAFPVPAGVSSGNGSPAERSSGGNGQTGVPDGNQGSDPTRPSGSGGSTDASGSGSTDSPGKGTGEGSEGSSGNKPAPGEGTATDGQRAVSEREAARLALAQVPGEVKEIEYSGRGSNRYYLVEIDSPNKGEAVVQIHAISGKVMSIAWDDDDDEDDDDDDDDA